MPALTFRSSLATDQQFETYLKTYLRDHKELNGSYETNDYFKNYQIRWNKRHGLILTTTTCLNISAAIIPSNKTENIAVSDLRRLILNKKVSDINVTLADVFENALSCEPQ
ncbi:hypothetical protein [Lentilactobacillus kisonensis]|uniref:Uncharacterized protein n=2 Tax=Lentilactobacillus kisonensis TaxID=481722 RepID=H1LDR3_9LACO|nr:hypothetical protein [Lentilactobacillus kisonensis]EHO53034.1 hypothetical protein HMPREF9104_00738 [Lentilactobacillus kisonensis F0435]KRL22718.1 hypothetical protein FC98_GL001951 [Lentilactobacillus kisonensis DSM 19906 = JCM 15041]